MKKSKYYDLNYHYFIDKNNQIVKLIYIKKEKIEKNNEFNELKIEL